MEPNSSVVVSDRHKLKRRKFHLNMKKNLLHDDGHGVLRHISQRGCGVSFPGDIQDTPGLLPLQSSLGSLLCH